MAIWQIGFFILPKESIESKDLFIVSDGHTFDDAPYWRAKDLHPTFFDRIASFMPRAKSWSEQLMIFGDEDSNRLEVFFENEIVESVSFRIDYTSNYENILCEIIEFCILNGFIILDEELKLVQLNFELVNSIINNAPQVRKYNQFLKAQESNNENR